MIDEEKRRGEETDASAGPDPIVSAMRDIPRMRSVEHLDGTTLKKFAPPPPTVSRIGGLAQGCGGVLLTVLGVVMLVAALWFGFYLWGPGLLLAGGVLLVGGTLGVWSGRRGPVVVSIAALLVSAVVGYFWYSFVPAAGALSPLGSLGVFMGPIALMVILVLGVALIANLASLYYWKRLRVSTQRHLIAWGAVAVVMLILVLALSYTQQSQRKSWLKDHLKTWSAEAAGDPVKLGSTMNVTLGYSFITTDEGDDDRLDVRLAELQSVLDSGAQAVRISVSGDTLLEVRDPRLFKLDEKKDVNEETAKAQARLDRQDAAETKYMAAVTGSGVPLILSDAQYSPYLLVVSNDTKEKTTWDTFTGIQEDRIRHYAALYQPYAYEVITEPAMYANYSALDEGDDDAVKLDNWVTQTEKLLAAVKEESPDTLVGVTVALHSDFDQDYYERALQIEGLDFIGVRIFQPGAFSAVDDLQAERGSAAEHGKALWIVETWYGYCLAPQRSMDLDSIWLETATAFAEKNKMGVVLTNDYGCFLQSGGTLFQTKADLSGRTEVWKRWKALVQAQTPAS